MHLLLFSSSKLSGYTKRFEYALDELQEFTKDIQEVTFVPYALKDMDMYTNMAREIFEPLGKKVRSVHHFTDPAGAIHSAEFIFIGGGNTFLLLDSLYKNNLLEPIREKVLSGTKYMGVSAGSNVACHSIKTTNDMPIIYPESFDALGFLPFNLNPHFIDTDPISTHMGETREDRIREFHEQNDVPVLGLREGAFLELKNGELTLKGLHGAKIFQKKKDPQDIPLGTSLNFLLKE